MKVCISLYGALRDADASGRVELAVPDGSTIGALREQLVAHLATHAPAIPAGLLRRSAFGTEEEILRDADPVPTDGRLVVLPPVGGG